MSNALKLALVLSVYACAACLGLAFVYNATAPAIAQAAEKEAFEAFAEFFPDADSFTDVSAAVPSPESKIVFDRVYRADKGGAFMGLLIQASGPTYKNSTLLSAFSPEGNMLRFKMTATTDTAGLGTKVGASPFADQFVNKNIADGFTLGKDIQAISGATISSRGAADILRASARAAGSYIDGGAL